MKYLLILFSVFAFGQASNEMVSFTQASSLGFALQAGQSHVTSNKCMTKSEALSKYSLSSASMSGFASNQLVPRSAWVSGATAYAFIFGNVGATSSSGVCALGNTGMTLYSPSVDLTVGSKLYYNIAMTDVFQLGEIYTNNWYKSGGYAYRIVDYVGVNNNTYDPQIAEAVLCTASRIQQSQFRQSPCDVPINNLWFDSVNNKYYTSSTGSTLYNGTVFEYIGIVNNRYDWRKSDILSGVIYYIETVNSLCSGE
jgi:hypothetical protein